MPIPSLYKIVLPGYVKAWLPPNCFKGAEHGKTIGIAYAVSKNVVQSWDGVWDLYFPSIEYDRISKGRSTISIIQLQNILDAEEAERKRLLEEENVSKV